MKPKLRDNEGLYHYISTGRELDKKVLSYIRSVARWFAVRRCYRTYIEYAFIVDKSTESYLALTFNLTTKSTVEIPD